MIKSFTLLVEEDFASKNVCGYIPELRLNVVGDSEEEVMLCAKDLIAIELEKNPVLKTFKSKVITLGVEVGSDVIASATAV